MSGGGRARVDAGELARRVNAAADLLEAGMPVAKATRTLADRFGCSLRQARRYVEQAGADGRVDVAGCIDSVHRAAAGAVGGPGAGSRP